MPPAPPADLNIIVQNEAPYNAEPRPRALITSFTTPQSLLYVRSHGDVPDLGRDHAIIVDGLVGIERRWTRDELERRFPVRTVTATMQCAGNRRADLQPVRETNGDPWGVGAIGNVEWTGVSLIDVLRDAGLDEECCRFVHLASADEVEVEGIHAPFEVSIPIDKAADPDVLIAWSANGEPLAPEHGAPLRLVTPGYAGVRSAKWLTRITASNMPSAAPMQAMDYKLFPADESGDDPDWSAGLTIEEMPVNSAICVPADGDRVATGEIDVEGYAVAYARDVARVELSADGGTTWQLATIERRDDARWSWIRWSATVSLHPGEHTLIVRAVDAAGQGQPANPAQVWNFAGYLSTAWHCIQVTAIPR